MPPKDTSDKPSTARNETPQRTLRREAGKTKRTVKGNLGPKGDGASAPQRQTKQ